MNNNHNFIALENLILATLNESISYIRGINVNETSLQNLLCSSQKLFNELPRLLEITNWGICFDVQSRIFSIVAETDYVYIDRSNLSSFKDLFCLFDSFFVAQNEAGDIDIHFNVHNLWGNN